MFVEVVEVVVVVRRYFENYHDDNICCLVVDSSRLWLHRFGIIPWSMLLSMERFPPWILLLLCHVVVVEADVSS